MVGRVVVKERKPNVPKLDQLFAGGPIKPCDRTEEFKVMPPESKEVLGSQLLFRCHHKVCKIVGDIEAKV